MRDEVTGAQLLTNFKNLYPDVQTNLTVTTHC